MIDTNPPQERKTAHQEIDQDPFPTAEWWEVRSVICDEQSAHQIWWQTRSLLNQVPDANRRASLWLLGRQIGSDYDSEAEGARFAGEWVRAMCRPPAP
jgi:hypothetical protein